MELGDVVVKPAPIGEDCVRGQFSLTFEQLTGVNYLGGRHGS